MKTMIIAGTANAVLMVTLAASFVSPAVPGWVASAAAVSWACAMMAWALVSGLCPEGGHYDR